jgi:magnesium chelatase subunit I
MIMGDRGTGKSTTIRALADLLPEIEVVADDPFSRSPKDPDVIAERGTTDLPIAAKKVPMVDLPLGATETASAAPSTLKKPFPKG